MLLRSENQPISGIPVFWQDPSTEIQQEWNRWIELFEATLMAKPSISLEELTRDEAGTPRRKELMGGAEEPSEKQHEKPYLTESQTWT